MRNGLRTSARRKPARPVRRTVKKPFDIDQIMARIRDAVRDYPKAVLFELANRGYGSAFQILVACIITIRTLEEVSLPTTLKLFGTASTPSEVARLGPDGIDDLIRACAFHGPKSRTIHNIAHGATEQFNGTIPCDFDALTSLPGVGPKCANLVLGIACDHPTGIPVDIHVHRITNRWGYVHAPTPQKTMAELQKVLPRRYWLEINKLMVPFGKHVCTGKLPRCSACPVLECCRQVGVTEHR